MGKKSSVNTRMKKFNEMLESVGSNIRVIGEYKTQAEEALFKCNKCGEEFKLKPILAKNKPVCRVCEYEKPERYKLADDINSESEWTFVKAIKNSVILKCNDCGEEHKFTERKAKKREIQCPCKGVTYTVKEVKEQALRIYNFMGKDSREIGYLEGLELDEYIKDIIAIDRLRESIRTNEEFINDVIDEVDRLYEERGITRCLACKRLFPEHKLYRGACYSKDIKKYCPGLPEEKKPPRKAYKKREITMSNSHIKLLENFIQKHQLSVEEFKAMLSDYESR